MNRSALAFSASGKSKALLDHEQEQRGHDEEHEGVARQPIGEPFPAGGLQIFLDRERPDVARAPAVQVAGSGMVETVFPPPLKIGCEAQETGESADDIISFPGF